MNVKVLSSLSAALVITSFVSPAIAEPLGGHPAMVVAPHSPKVDWSAAIGTGHAGRTGETSDNRTGSVELNAVATQRSKPDWTATIGTGTAATSRSGAPNTDAHLPSGTQAVVATAHWTSKIGSGHPFDSASPVLYTPVANTR
jgi:hypothetical protein